MEESLLPMRSPEALAALDIFYDEFNDVHFFVEDEDQENLYEVILRRMFPDLQIARIFPLGGKRAVLDHDPQSIERDTKPQSIYLVDKDFDDLLGVKVQKPGLFYLDRYCIENYFVDPDAIVEFVVETAPKLKRPEIATNLNIFTKLTELMESLLPLFQMFYCVQRFELGIKNCSLPAERFCLDRNLWKVNPAAVAEYRDEVIRAASGTQHAAALADPHLHPEVAALTQLDLHGVISGKHLCKLVFHYLKSKYNLGSITFESFLFRICKNSSLNALSTLASEIRMVLASAESAAQ